jgi:hypothetical protein
MKQERLLLPGLGARRAVRERSALTGLLRSCFARTQTWPQAGKYVSALVSDPPLRNGWSVAEHAGDRTPGKCQRLLNRSCWDEAAAMSQVRKYAAAGLDEAARRSRRRRMAVGALDETARGTRMTCADVVKKLAKGSRGWEVRSVGQGAKGERWYACSWIAAASPRHSLLVRRHLETGELAFHYCYVPEGQAAAKARLIRAAGLRWPVEEVSGPGRAASAWTSARPGSTPRSCGTSCWSWPPSPSEWSPPPSGGTAPVPRHRRPPARTKSGPQTPA